MQKDLDVFLVKYDEKHSHQGRNMNGMTFGRIQEGAGIPPNKESKTPKTRQPNHSPEQGDCQAITITVQTIH